MNKLIQVDYYYFEADKITKKIKLIDDFYKIEVSILPAGAAYSDELLTDYFENDEWLDCIDSYDNIDVDALYNKYNATRLIFDFK